MKKLFLIICLLPIIGVMAQKKVPITLKMEETPISVVLNELTKIGDYSFVIPTNDVDVNRKVNLSVTNQNIEQVLALLFANQDVQFDISGRQIKIIKRRPTSSTSAPIISYNGVVVDENNQPIPGVIIQCKATKEGTITDINGDFTFRIPLGSSVTVSYIGYETQQLKADQSKPVSIQLNESQKNIDEIVVVGYGVQRKSDLTGSVVSIKSEKLNETPTTSMAEMLRGKAAGVQVNISSAKPGGSSTMLIRGRRSLSGGNNPLYVVDGVPMDGIDEVNANDIESLEILKDASSQSIYGARAANGVVLVTTKRGVVGKPKIDYNAYVGQQSIHRNFDFYNGEEWAAYRKEAFFNANGYYNEEQCMLGLMKEVLESGQWVDWEKMMITPALQQKHDITIRSGNDVTKMLVSVGYFYQDGMVKNSDYKRLTGRLNVDHKLYKNLLLGANISYTRSWTNESDGSFNSYITMPPLAKVYNEDGSLRMDVTEAGESHYNPLWNIDRSIIDAQTSSYLINLYADWEIIEGLTYRANGSMRERMISNGNYLFRDHTTGKNTNGKATVVASTNTDLLFENILNFNKEFNRNHRLGITLMQSVNQISYKTQGQTATGFPNDDLGYNALSSALEFGVPSWGLSQRRLLSYMGRANYSMLNRYLFSVAMRIDGASVFGKSNKYGYFPSGSFAWRMNEEEFLNADWLSNLKLRLSWGQVGNQGISPYTTLGLTERYINEFGDIKQIGFLPSGELWNPNLKWETSTTTNIGLDFGFFNERLSGTVEMYNTQTSDLLVNRSISQSLGYTKQMMNLGKVENKGIEITLNATPVKTKEITWNIFGTFAANRNKILKITGETDSNGKPLDDVNSKWFIGQPINVHYDYMFDGIWQLTDNVAESHMPTATQGMIKIKDGDKSGDITTSDRIIMQKDPKWISSFGTSLHAFGADLSCEFYMVKGGTLYNNYLTDFNTGGDLTGKRNGIRRNYWTINNPSNDTPSPNFTQPPAYISTLGYQDASYFRLRNVTLGYELPQKLTQKAYIQKLRFYVTANNLFTLTKVLSYGPESDTGSYPEPRTFLIGMNLSF